MIELKYIEFKLVLRNGEECTVRYCDSWGVSLFGNRTIHFEFLDCLSISSTRYRSEFRVVGEHDYIDPKKAAKQIIEHLTEIKLNGKNSQLKLI
jgi:hypothetical protein